MLCGLLLYSTGATMYQPLGTTRYYFERIDSTHRHAVCQGVQLTHGTLIIADYQEQGRGRLGRSWDAPACTSLLVSLVVKPPLSPAVCPQLTHVMTLAAARALRARGLAVILSWPNDLMCRGRKIGGMLSEAVLDGDRLDFAVLSAGINLNQGEKTLARINRPATSCFVETGRRWDRDEVLESLVDQLNELYPAVVERGFPAIKAEWETLSSLTGSTITLDLGGRSVQGVVSGFDDEGRIILSHREGVTSFAAGEVTRVRTDAL